jgi:hypothetical protein
MNRLQKISCRVPLIAASISAAFFAPLAFAHDEDLGELAPSCIVNAAAPFGGSTALARLVTVEADLTNLQENPAILDRTATGTFRATIRFERTSAATAIPTRAVVNAVFRFNVLQNETITAAHFHGGLPGSNGSIVVPLNPANRFDVAAGTEGVVQTQFEAADTPTINTLLNIASDPSLFYANVHSVAKPGGIARGQLRNAVAEDAGCLRSAVGAVGADIASLQSDVTTIKADVASIKSGAGNTAALDQNIKNILRLAILSAARDGIIGAQERDQLLQSVGQ